MTTDGPVVSSEKMPHDNEDENSQTSDYKSGSTPRRTDGLTAH
jgi:hypothetical protein